jgi:hypothetical protein
MNELCRLAPTLAENGLFVIFKRLPKTRLIVLTTGAEIGVASSFSWRKLVSLHFFQGGNWCRFIFFMPKLVSLQEFKIVLVSFPDRSFSALK